MISFPNAKINLGLLVTAKRSDGYHDIETIFYPVAISDMLEIVSVPSDTKSFSLGTSGIPVPGNGNLCEKAYRKFTEACGNQFPDPSIQMHLHKSVPIGAGLGGGSSDAAFVLKMMNDLFEKKFTDEKLMDLASEIGSDCAFFIKNKPLFASGRGNIFKDVTVNLCQYFITLVMPKVHVSTAWAYAEMIPKKTEINLIELVQSPPDHWKDRMLNDFEIPVFKKFPELQSIKEKLYKSGAVYASMSGSGSAFFGIFREEKDLGKIFPGCSVHTSKALF